MSKKISSYKDYMKAALEMAYENERALTADNREHSARDRYRRDSSELPGRTPCFASRIIHDDPQYIDDSFHLLAQMDEYIANETDPVKKTMAIAAMHVAAPKFEKYAELKLFSEVDEKYHRQLEADYEITPSAREEIDKVQAEASQFSFHYPYNGDFSTMSQLSMKEQCGVYKKVLRSFFDRRAFIDDIGRPMDHNMALSEAMLTVNAVAEQISEVAAGKKPTTGKAFKPLDKKEKQLLESLKADYKKLDKDKAEQVLEQVEDFKRIDSYRAMDVEPKRTELKLSLDNNPFVGITAEEFLSKQQNRQLSAVETEWGEAAIDSMLEGIYTLDELRALRRSGIDPAEGILVDGQPMTWFDRNKKLLPLGDRANLKCNIIAQAMNGAKIDVCKLEPDKEVNYNTMKLVPVKTELKMNTEKRSFWTWLKQLFGFEPSIKDKVKTANKADRDYLRSAQSKTADAAYKNSVVSLLNKSVGKHNDVLDYCQSAFFERTFGAEAREKDVLLEQVVGTRMSEAVTFFDGGNQHDLIKTMNRPNSATNMAILYAMTKGYTYDQVTDYNFDIDRGAIGAEFVEKFTVMSKADFARSKNLRPSSSAANHEYDEYLRGKYADVDSFCAAAHDALLKEKLIPVDPTNPLEFAKNYGKIAAMGGLLCDYCQAFESIVTRPVIGREERYQKQYDRAAAMQRYATDDMFTQENYYLCAGKLADFYRSNMYMHPETVNYSESEYTTVIDVAAKARASMSFLNEQLGNKPAAFADIAKDSKLRSLYNGLTSVVTIPSTTDKEVLSDHLTCLCSTEEGYNTVRINPEKMTMTDGNFEIDCLPYVQNEAELQNKNKANFAKFVPGAGESGIAERYEAFATGNYYVGTPQTHFVKEPVTVEQIKREIEAEKPAPSAKAKMEKADEPGVDVTTYAELSGEKAQQGVTAPAKGGEPNAISMGRNK